MTLTSRVGPWVLLLFTFLLGLGAVMNDPAWQAITPELVPAEQHASAVALNSAGFNVARAVGPALGGIIVAAVGCGTTFLLNAFSFLGVILFLYHWKRPIVVRPKTQRVWSAIGDGFTYVRESGLAKSVLLRTGTFSVAAVAMLALLPIIARPYGARGYGVLLGCFGLGALLGALALPRLRESLSVSGRGVDRNPGVPECGGADHVSALCSRPGAVILLAGVAGRHGGRSHTVGCAGKKNWRSGCARRGCGSVGAGRFRAARAPHHGE
jgi:MFS family permease